MNNFNKSLLLRTAMLVLLLTTLCSIIGCGISREKVIKKDSTKVTAPAVNTEPAGKPKVPASRFHDNGNNTMKDNKTGLIWQIKSDEELKTWQEAMTYAENLTLAGHSNWRLPANEEWEAMLKINEEEYEILADLGFIPNLDDNLMVFFSYWASTSNTDDSSKAYYVILHPVLNGIFNDAKKSDTLNIHCVTNGK